MWIPLAGIIAVLLVLFAALALLLSTERGLHFGLQVAQRFAPGELSWSRATGQLIGPLRLEDIEYRQDGNRYRIGRVSFDWSPGRLLARRLSVHRLHVDDVDILLAESTEEAPAEPFEPGWSLPVELVLRDLQLTDLTVRKNGAEPVSVATFRLTAHSGLDWLQIERLQLRMAQLALDVQGRLGLGADSFTDLSLDWRATLPGYAPVAAQGRIEGTWRQALFSQQFTAPTAGQLRLAVREPFADLRWALELEVPETLLTDVNATWPAQRLGIALSGNGSLGDAELGADLKTDWAASEVYPLRIDAQATRDEAGRLQLQPLVVQQGDSRVRLTGNWDPDQERFEARLAADHVRWPLVEAPQLAAPHFELQASGRLEDYRLSLSARLEGPGIPAAEIAGSGRGDAERLQIEQIGIQTLDGTVQATGTLGWAPALAWDLEIAAHDIDPGRHWPDWPGRISAQLRGEGVLDGALRAAAHIDQLAGELRGYPVGGQGSVRWQDERLQVEALQLSSGDARLEVDGSLADRWDIDWTLSAPELQHLAPHLAGTLNAAGRLVGARETPRLQLEATLKDFALDQARLAALQLNADAGLEPGAALRLSARGQDLRLAERSFDTLRLDLTGQREQHLLDLLLQGADHELQLLARGGWDGESWTGRLEHADWRLPETGAWYLDEAVALRLGADTGNLENACWRQEATRLCGAYDYGPEAQRVEARLTEWPLANLHDALPPDLQIRGGSLTAQLDAELPTQGVARAEAQLQLTPGSLTWQESGQPVETGFGGADGSLRLDAEGARAELQLRLSGNDQLALQAWLPEYRPGVAPSAQPLRGSLQGEVRDFSLLDALMAALDEPSGVLRLDATLDGTLAAPEMRGALQLSEGRAFVGPAGVQVEEVQLEVRGDPIAGRLELQGSARSGPGRIELEGSLAEFRSPQLSGELQIAGERFEAVNLPEARVLVTPTLQASVRAGAVEVSGEVHIPEARIEPRDLSGAVTPSSDVVLVQEEEAPAPPGWTLSSRVRVSLGEAVHFDGFGLSGRLTGAVEVIDLPDRVTLARGELAVKDGLYTAYGQELEIEQGRVLYRDSPLGNPALDVRAVRRTGDVVAGVRVLGTAQDPEAELFSTPGMPQADVLSYLLLGRPVANASGGEGELLMQAATSLGLKGGNALAERIGGAFGLDEVSVGGGGDLDTAALTVGKYLSPRLYLNYSVGLLDAANRLRLRYELSKRLSLQTETGTETGGDLLYRIER
ncbi:MAG: translocation/assembly module TamB domain-containing protein [Thiohalobacteraceae bacterium]